MNSSTISINPSEDFTLDLAFKNADGSAYDLTGASVRFEVRRSATSADVIDKTVTNHSDPTAGLTSIVLTESDTALAIRAWQFVFTLASGSDSVRSNIGYLVVTNNAVTTSTVVVMLDSGAGSVDLTLGGNGSGGDKYFRQDFTVTDTLAVHHDLNKRPAVTVVDSAGDEVIVDIQYLDDNVIILDLAGGFAGSVYCN